MAIGDDFTVDYTNKMISHSNGTSIYSVNALYSYLQDTFDEQGQMDDTVPMSAQTPSEYTMINGWFMPNKATRYLASGSIQSSGYNNEIYVSTHNNSTPFAATDVGKIIIGVTSDDSGSLLDFDVDIEGNTKAYIRASSSADTFSTGEVLDVIDGTGNVTQTAGAVTGEDVFGNIYTLGSLVAGTELYVKQSGSVSLGVDESWWISGHIDILVKVQESGVLIDSGDLIVFAREFNNQYDHFPITVVGSRNAVPLATSADGFNETVSGSIGDVTGSVSITFGSITRDLDNGNGFVLYDAEINAGGYLLSSVYEVLKFRTYRERTSDIDDGAGTVLGYTYTDATSGSYTAVKTAPFGTFTGKFFGARGIYVTNLHTDDVKNFRLIDATGTTQDPPNTVAVTITAVSQSDRVGVFRLVAAAGAIDKTEYFSSASDQLYNGLTSQSFHVSGTINADVPKAGTIRIGNEAYHFTTWSNTTVGVLSGSFTITGSESFSVAYGDNSASYIPIIDAQVGTGSVSVANTLVQSTSIPVVVRVRQKGILPFEIEGTVSSTGLSLAAIRTNDSIVT